MVRFTQEIGKSKWLEFNYILRLLIQFKINFEFFCPEIKK